MPTTPRIEKARADLRIAREQCTLADAVEKASKALTANAYARREELRLELEAAWDEWEAEDA